MDEAYFKRIEQEEAMAQGRKVGREEGKEVGRVSMLLDLGKTEEILLMTDLLKMPKKEIEKTIKLLKQA